MEYTTETHRLKERIKELETEINELEEERLVYREELKGLFSRNNRRKQILKNEEMSAYKRGQLENDYAEADEEIESLQSRRDPITETIEEKRRTTNVLIRFNDTYQYLEEERNE